MNLCDLSTIKQIMAAHGLTFRKEFGQNFLTRREVVEEIADRCCDDENTTILEIGPGIGVLTQELAMRHRKVIAVEIDRGLIPVLHGTLAEYDNIELHNADVMEVDLPALLAPAFAEGPVAVCANLPYYITTPIILGLLEKQYKIESITVMIQKEVAERISATEKSKDYGALSIAVQYYCDVNYDFTVSAGCFIPQPKVDSSVITLTPTKEKKYKTNNEKLFFKIVKCSFGQRRKTLVNSIANQSGLAISKEQIASVLEGMGLDARVRGEALSITQFCELADRIEKMI